MVCGVVCGVWCEVCCEMCGVWCEVCGVWCGVWCVVWCMIVCGVMLCWAGVMVTYHMMSDLTLYVMIQVHVQYIGTVAQTFSISKASSLAHAA